TSTSLPMPGSVKLFLASRYARFASSSRRMPACFLVISAFSASAAATCDLDILAIKNLLVTRLLGASTGPKCWKYNAFLPVVQWKGLKILGFFHLMAEKGNNGGANARLPVRSADALAPCRCAVTDL